MATEEKYDRQLRLWGSHGQKKLSQSQILLFGADGLGTQTLKNLVLPGICEIVIIDDALVNQRDLSNNFFVTPDSLSKPRAQVGQFIKQITLDLLLEMNPDVKGKAIVASVKIFCEKDTQYFKSASFAIMSQKNKRDQKLIEQCCLETNTAYITLNTYGFFALSHLWTPELAVIESKPADVETHDLRLNFLFPQLGKYASQFKLDDQEMSDAQHKHIPFPVVLLFELQKWKKAHDDQLPKTFQEKQDFKSQIKASSRDFGQEVNYEEAVKYSYLLFKNTDPPNGLFEAFKTPVVARDMARNEKFWTLIDAAQAFLKQTGQLPLTGKVSDMTADTVSFLDLQKVYQEKFKADSQKIKQLVKNKGITDQEVEIFCANILQTQVHRFRSLKEKEAQLNPETLEEEWLDDESLLDLYFVLEGLQCFQEVEGQLPQNKEANLEKLNGVISAICKERCGKERKVNQDLVIESLRGGRAQLHNIAAFMGGMAAQEIVKVVVEQYTPFNNTFIYEGISARGQVLKL